MTRTIRFALLIIVSALFSIQAQSKEAQEILEKLKEKFSKVKDYEVKINIKIDVDFLKVPVTDAVMIYKQPDKVKINSEGFAMLPKQGLNFSPIGLLKNDHTSFLEKDEQLNGNLCSVVKVIPLGDTKDVILSTLWIDKKNLVIRKIESSTKFNGTFQIDLDYEEKVLKNYPLPSRMIFTFDINKTPIPKGFTGDPGEETPKRKNKLTRGTVTVSFSDYIVNKGIPDTAFDDTKKKKK